MDYGEGSGAVAACAGHNVDACFEWLEVLEQGGGVQRTNYGSEGAEMVVGSKQLEDTGRKGSEE